VDPWQLHVILMFEDVGGLERMSKNKEKVSLYRDPVQLNGRVSMPYWLLISRLAWLFGLASVRLFL
jgi:hypothetical protein